MPSPGPAEGEEPAPPSHGGRYGGIGDTPARGGGSPGGTGGAHGPVRRRRSEAAEQDEEAPGEDVEEPAGDTGDVSHDEELESSAPPRHRWVRDRYGHPRAPAGNRDWRGPCSCRDPREAGCVTGEGPPERSCHPVTDPPRSPSRAPGPPRWAAELPRGGSLPLPPRHFALGSGAREGQQLKRRRLLPPTPAGTAGPGGGEGQGRGRGLQ